MRRTFFIVLLVVLLTFCAWSYGSGGIMRTLMDPAVAADARLNLIRDYFAAWGTAAPLAYMTLVIIEVVVAPIPGTLLYLPGGVIFGWWIGGLVSLSGNVIGAGIACLMIRSLGRRYLEPYLEKTALVRYEGLLEQRGLWLIFFLRLNPLTSSDLVSYAAGLTRIPVWKVMAGTFLGMTPLCFAQAYFAQEVFSVFPGLIYPLVFVGIVYLAYVVHIVRKLVQERVAAPAD